MLTSTVMGVEVKWIGVTNQEWLKEEHYEEEEEK